MIIEQGVISTEHVCLESNTPAHVSVMVGVVIVTS